MGATHTSRAFAHCCFFSISLCDSHVMQGRTRQFQAIIRQGFAWVPAFAVAGTDAPDGEKGSKQYRFRLQDARCGPMHGSTRSREMDNGGVYRVPTGVKGGVYVCMYLYIYTWYLPLQHMIYGIFQNPRRRGYITPGTSHQGRTRSYFFGQMIVIELQSNRSFSCPSK